MQILCVIRSRPDRLGGLTRLIPSASKEVLTENLRELEASGIVVRRDLSGTVRHVEYDFSEAMRPAMISMLDHLAELGEFHLANYIVVLQDGFELALTKGYRSDIENWLK